MNSRCCRTGGAAHGVVVGIVEDELGADVAIAVRPSTPNCWRRHRSRRCMPPLPAVGDAPPREVVVKVLRREADRRRRGLAQSLAAVADRTHPNADKIRPREIGRDREHAGGRDRPAARRRQRLGAAPQLADSPDPYVPEPITTSPSAYRRRTRARHQQRRHRRDRRRWTTARRSRPRACACSTPRCSATIFHADAHAGNIGSIRT